VTAVSPKPGTSVVEGSKVRLNVASGPKPVVVPKVVGETLSQASADLHALGFNVNPTYVDDAAPQNQVISQDPKPGDQAPKKSTVDVKVSNGPPQVDVPDVTGQSQDQATQTLQKAGFKVTAQPTDVADPTQDGIVQSQDPAGGQAAKGSTVTIVVGHFNAGGTTTLP
jgi:serine/threonine-protein kinase